MSLLGIDVGTTGCKAIAFSEEGQTIAGNYVEYDVKSVRPGYAELDAIDVWEKIKTVIAKTAAATIRDPIAALSIASLGEAVVPVSGNREILAPSILFFDVRGQEYVETIAAEIDSKSLYSITGNAAGPHYTLPKILWIKDHQRDLYDRTHKFLLWGSFIGHMLGAEATVDYSLANRTLCFDVDNGSWSRRILEIAGVDGAKLPDVVRSGTIIGGVSEAAAAELHLPVGADIVAGGHDQCANATGCGALDPGQSMYGMGTFICAAPVFQQRPADSDTMLEFGLCTEHHTRDDRFITFIYNQGGCLVKWFRETFAASEHARAVEAGRDVYKNLFAEIPDDPVDVTVMPYFTGSGPPRFYADPSGSISGLKLTTTRGEILKGILQGITFYLSMCIDVLPRVGIEVTEFRAVGGGSNSDAWIQLSADIIGKPFTRARVSEAGALGAAIIAGAGCGVFDSLEQGAAQMVAFDRTFEPDPKNVERYAAEYERYKQIERFTEQNLFASPDGLGNNK